MSVLFTVSVAVLIFGPNAVSTTSIGTTTDRLPYYSNGDAGIVNQYKSNGQKPLQTSNPINNQNVKSQLEVVYPSNITPVQRIDMEIRFLQQRLDMLLGKRHKLQAQQGPHNTSNLPSNDSGIINEAQLIAEVSKAHQRGERIVMTNGVFDILHAGHVSYLANARMLGDRLIVAVNSDASTRRLKGETRPVNTLVNRMKVLSALEAVDWVIGFEEDTPQRLITKILPDLLVKGGDYKPEDIAGSKEVLANGGDVRVLNFEDGFSTSNIIKTIISRNGKSC